MNPAERYGIRGKDLSSDFFTLLRISVPITAKSKPDISPNIPRPAPKIKRQAGINFTSAPPILLFEITATASKKMNEREKIKLLPRSIEGEILIRPISISIIGTKSSTLRSLISHTLAKRNTPRMRVAFRSSNVKPNFKAISIDTAILSATHTLLNLLFFVYCGVLVKTAPDISPAHSIYMGIAKNIGINTEARIAVIIESVIYELPFIKGGTITCSA